MCLSQFDVETAFLNGYLEEDIFMKQPEGYDDGTGRVCHLKRSLYGLKQAPRCFNIRFVQYLKQNLKFKQSDADPCLFVRKTESSMIMIALYVDDGLVASTDKKSLDAFLDELRMEFKITTKSASYFLGLEIEQREDTIKISQKAYTKKILEKFGMNGCRSISTPMVKDGKIEENQAKVSDFPYRQIIGALMYLMVGTRPDISYALGVVSRSLENPSATDILRVKRILRYLKGSIELGISYTSGYKSGILESFSDADHGNDESTARSTTGVVAVYAGGAISWISQRQCSVAISTTEAEVVAASEGAREIIWLKRLFEDLIDLQSTPVLFVDNEAAIRLSQNPEFHRRTKHIRIRHFFVRELVTSGEIKVEKISTQDQTADILTKPLHKPRHEILCKKLGLLIDP
ncbi:Reverse transcriptase (RNA-dependent DNA polymerase) [Nesidiocoris tenuis]|uniref:Reverse transcriptase (RNA-dependent DNA polymerase) n=1 Tax=Nesidiocoris tenuis TaxID=355587 RepID=A0ABN7BA03_9HEMI|nr:Reverse transcriptase (RNA-dependent DNA polymerase) [Nesidiocoris tenuis]